MHCTKSFLNPVDCYHALCLTAVCLAAVITFHFLTELTKLCGVIYFLQQKKRQKTLAKIKQLAEKEDSDNGAIQQKGKSKSGSRKGSQTKGAKKDAPAKKSSPRKGTKQSAAAANCNILPYFTVKK